jgi:alkaline phosphatase D
MNRNLHKAHFQVVILFISLLLMMPEVLVAQPDSPLRSILNPSLKPFYHGVASGDPTSTQVIIWTRVTPDSGSVNNLDVYWQVATDSSFTNIVNYGYKTARPENDYTVKADVCGLQPATWYYYAFQSGDRNSLTGRTRTAPDPNSTIDSARFAIVSCASYEHGYFNAYQNIADRNDVDAVLHLGDYIYEYGQGEYSSNIAGRVVEPANEIISKADYRIRHSAHKLDNQARRCHQLFPFITVWDDHETANDSYRDGAANHQANEGPWAVRKLNSVNTYYEWMPLRRPDLSDTFRIYRNFKWGKLANLIMLDSRLYGRDLQDNSERNDSVHQLLGPVQQSWLLNQLSDTSSQWHIIGNQVMFAPLTVFGQPVSDDAWDGYAFHRKKIQDHILNNNINNVVVLTGDIHTAWANDIPGTGYNSSTGANSVAVEFVGSSITSSNSPLPVGVSIIKTANPHMKYINLNEHGYYFLNISKGLTQADYRFLPVDQISTAATDGENWYVKNNERFLRKANAPVAASLVSAPVPSSVPNTMMPFAKIDRVKEATVLQNTPTVINIAPSTAVCPAITLSILNTTDHGTANLIGGIDVLYSPDNNFSGNDTMTLTVCETANSSTCDTISVHIKVKAVIHIDTVYVNISSDSSFSSCTSFDDLYTSLDTSRLLNVLNGTATKQNDTCFSYVPLPSFTGYEHILFEACDSGAFRKCDTVLYIVRVNLPIVKDHITLITQKNKSISYCLSFDDLKKKANGTMALVSVSNGLVSFSNDTCFTYKPDSGYVGNDYFLAVNCDSASGVKNCDSIEVFIQVKDNYTTQVYSYNAVSGTVLPVCYSFDDLTGSIDHPVIIHNSAHALIQVTGDTCFNYYAATGFSGVDTIKIYTCDNLAPANCDTVLILVNTNITSINEADDLAVMSVHPNPFAGNIAMQFYLFIPGSVSMRLIDINGRQIGETQLYKLTKGLHIKGFDTSVVPSGIYFFEIRTDKETYTKKMIKF